MNYELEEVIDQLRKRGARINQGNRSIDISRPNREIGIDTLGKLDFIRKAGYSVTMPEYKFEVFSGNVGAGK